MKKWIGLFGLWLMAVSGVTAQLQQSSLLWRISGNGLASASYVFGTFHIMCKNDFKISETLRAKIKNSRQFYGELKLDDPGMQMQMATKLMMKDKTIESMMSAEEYQKMSDAFQKTTQMPFSLFNRFKPFMSESLVTINLIECDEKVQPETEFVGIAKENNIPVLGLETLDDELAAIDKMPLDSQVHSLKETLLNLDSSKIEMARMIRVYKTGNVDSLYRFVTKSPSGNFENELIINRNKNWLPVITNAMHAMPSFFAVGAGHLGGPSGVLALLKKKGYKVTPVKY